MAGFLGPSFLPSEIARLVLGYLKTEGCGESYRIFLSESRYLAEYRSLLEQGQEFPTSIVGKGLTDMLEEYGQLKIQDANPTNDVLGKFDKAVNQLRSLTRLSQNTVSLKKNTITSFQKRRASQNLKKNTQFKIPFSYTDENDLALHCNASVTSDPASSPRSHVDDESPNSSAEPNSSNEAQGSVSLSQHSSHSSSGGSVHHTTVNDNLTTSTPGRVMNDTTLTGQSFPLPYQSPIVVSDSDHPFSPDSYPGTPRYQSHFDQCGNNVLKEVNESPKTVENGQVYVGSPLVKSIRNESLTGSPKDKIQGSPKNLMTNNNNNARMSRQKQIEAMRTGKLSQLLTSSNINDSGKFGPTITLQKNPIQLTECVKTSDAIKKKKVPTATLR